jgi:CRP/FNR family transcriptional regulator, cyclic AMP receptor protein
MVAIELLAENSFFKVFSEEQLKKMSEIAEELSYRAGAQVYKKGDQAGFFYLVEAGKIILIMDVNVGPMKPPMQVTVDFVTRGEVMGWSSVVEPYVYTLGARCIENSRLIAFNAVKLRDFIQSEPSLGLKFMQETAKVIASRLTHTQIILVGERGLSVLSDY